MNHPTTTPPSAKRRQARETLQSAVSDDAGAVETDWGSAVWADCHWHDSGETLRLSDSDFPDGWGIVGTTVESNCTWLRVGPK